MPATVEYDSRGKRVRKTLPDSFKARAFYARMYKAGKNPAVVYKQARLEQLTATPVTAPRYPSVDGEVFIAR